jgi:hypothetical protein
MASYDEMKEAARREALGEQASKFYEMARTPRMFQTVGDVAPPRDPLAGLPVDPKSLADLDARYAEVDRHLAAAEAARARIPAGAKRLGMNYETPDYADKYGVGVAGAQNFGSYTPMVADDSYGDLEALEKRGLISIQPGMRSEIARVRAQARGQTAAMNAEREAMNEAYRVSPLGEQVRAPRGPREASTLGSFGRSSR